MLAVKQRLVLMLLLWVGALWAWRNTRLEAPPPSPDLRRELRAMALRFAVIAPVLTLTAWLALPEFFLGFPRQRPMLWLAVMIGYPLLSVWPQEMLYRRFLFSRYAPLFGAGSGYLAASALAFGYAHIILMNAIAPVVTAGGGLLFAAAYARHRSLMLVCLEHALYGCALFTVGLGRFFFTGAAWHP